MHGFTSGLSLPTGRQVDAAPAYFLDSLLGAQKRIARRGERHSGESRGYWAEIGVNEKSGNRI
jgi:hypothetical protein